VGPGCARRPWGRAGPSGRSVEARPTGRSAAAAWPSGPAGYHSPAPSRAVGYRSPAPSRTVGWRLVRHSARPGGWSASNGSFQEAVRAALVSMQNLAWRAVSASPVAPRTICVANVARVRCARSLCAVLQVSRRAWHPRRDRLTTVTRQLRRACAGVTNCCSMTHLTRQSLTRPPGLSNCGCRPPAQATPPPNQCPMTRQPNPPGRPPDANLGASQRPRERAPTWAPADSSASGPAPADNPDARGGQTSRCG
jgi:hypothetical protein